MWDALAKAGAFCVWGPLTCRRTQATPIAARELRATRACMKAASRARGDRQKQTGPEHRSGPVLNSVA